MLNLHLICEYKNWVFGMEGREGEACVLELPASIHGDVVVLQPCFMFSLVPFCPQPYASYMQYV